MMASQSLLTKVNRLPYAARFKALREAGIEALTNPKIAVVLDSWERGDWQQRLYCLQSCMGSGDASRLRRMIDDPSRTVANLALKFLAVYGSDAVLVEALTNLPNRRRLLLLKRLRKQRLFLDNCFALRVTSAASLF